MKTIKEIFAALFLLVITFVFCSLQIYTIYFIIIDMLNSSLTYCISFAGIYILISIICYKLLFELKTVLNLSL